MAGASRGEKVILGPNETAVVADQGFSKISTIPDAALIHNIPEPYNCEHQISLNDTANKSEDEDAVINVNSAKNFKFFVY